MLSRDSAETHFGFRKVSFTEKPELVRGVFSNVATRYDLMNDLMSGGVHRLWKEALIDWLLPRPGDRLLDIAGGTGDISFRFLRRVKNRAEAVVCDFTPEMLFEGARRAEKQCPGSAISWVAGDAMAVPFADKSFNKATISFGIRNVVDPQRALSEIYRILRPGGRFICLEFSRVNPSILRRLYDAYSFNVIPAVGGIIAHDRESYQYLVESIRNFPDQETFADMLRLAGFRRVTYRNMTGGIVAMHSGWRL
jgi:demethylmenaquinone methyltransferase/2-methoxy-6-polyprenyl-1,4-benzoquinol methylase